MPVPPNALEDALAAAAADPGARPRFYRLLLDATLAVVGEVDGMAKGSSTLPAGAKVQLQHVPFQEGTAIPVYTSLAQLQATVTERVPYLELPARALFEMTRGATLLLNPNADYGKILTPSEIGQLLDGSIFQNSQRITVDAPRDVLLGQPAERPEALLDALRGLFRQHPAVAAAYLARISDAEGSRLLVVLRATPPLDRLREDLGVVVSNVDESGPLDLVVLDELPDGSEGFAGYFDTVEPFYTAA